MNDKNELKKSVRLRFSDIQVMVNNIAKAKQAYRDSLAKLVKIQLQGDYTEAYVTKERKKAETVYKEALRQSAEKIDHHLEYLGKDVRALHSGLDLDNPRWQTAATIIQSLSGDPEIDGELIRQVNAEFAGDQPALRALRAMYRSKGLYDGGIDKMIYDPESMISNLRETARQVASGNATINALAGRIGKMADLEGTKFNSLPDPEGVMEAARSGAGLSVD